MLNQQITNENVALSLTSLLSNLEESVFLSKLSSLIKDRFTDEQNEIYALRNDGSVSLMAVDGKHTHEVSYSANEAIFNYINKIRRPYFTNSVSRDPIFSTFLKKRPVVNSLDRELVYPILVADKVIAFIHLRSSSLQYSDKDFSRIRDFLASYHSAFENFSNYMMVKYVNNQIMHKLENSSDRQQKSSFKTEQDDQLIGLDKRIQSARSTIDRASQGDFPVLIEGNLGVGKRFVAKKIHQLSLRSASQMIIFECGVRDEDSLEKELFGFMDRIGMLEHANHGTIILSDINELPQSVQSKLVQFMTSGWIMRVNAKEKIALNVRIIATAKSNIVDLVAVKKFREDLYYRLNTLSIRLPSLSERKDDIKLLADHFLNHGKASRKYLSGSVLRKLEEHSWGANILELRSIMERAYMLTDGDCVDSIELNTIKTAQITKNEEISTQQQSSIADEEITLFELEKKFIFKTLVRLGGNKTKAAKALGITVKTLYNKLHSYGIEFEEKVSALN